MTLPEAPKLTNIQTVETIVAQLPEPPVKERKGIEDFYQRIDPGNELSVAIRIDPEHKRSEKVELKDERVERVFWSKNNSKLHLEATVRLSWQDLQHFQEKNFNQATVLGTFFAFGCASMDQATGEITISEKVPDGTKAKQAIIDYILAHKDTDGSWVVGGIKRRKSSEMVFQSAAPK